MSRLNDLCQQINKKKAVLREKTATLSLESYSRQQEIPSLIFYDLINGLYVAKDLLNSESRIYGYKFERTFPGTIEEQNEEIKRKKPCYISQLMEHIPKNTNFLVKLYNDEKSIYLGSYEREDGTFFPNYFHVKNNNPHLGSITITQEYCQKLAADLESGLEHELLVIQGEIDDKIAEAEEEFDF